jgi:hypothetical protein
MIANCTLSGNSSEYAGAVYAQDSASPALTNCILSGDSSPNGSEIALMYDSSLTLSYSNVYGGMSAVYTEQDSTIEMGDGNMATNPLFVAGPLGDYYLSQQASGQDATSPCVDAGRNTVVNVGLESYTTRTDEVGDTDRVDMGYHYPGFVARELSQINCGDPANETAAYSPQTFAWTTNGGSNNMFVVDMAFSLSGPYYTSAVIHGETHWTMPDSWWDRIPSGSFVYWRVRGADLDVTPLNIIYSDELWWFYKP